MKLWFLALTLAAASASPAPVVDRDVSVRMRDGVSLRADVLRPAASGKFPTLVYRTPYGRRRATEDYTTVKAAVARGYAVVCQDVRGRYGSEGEFVPYRHDGPDGYDTIEWAAAQPWSDGNVGTFGLSYPGAVQWLAAVESPPHLKAMVPAMTFSTARNFIYSGGVFDLSWYAWIHNNIAPDVRARKSLPGPRTSAAARKEWAALRETLQRRLPVSDVPELRDVAPYLFEWMTVPPGDPAWDWMEIRGKYDRVKAAVLNLSGWHDEAYGPEGAATNHAGLVAARRGSDARSELVIGPWIHGSVVMNDREAQTRSGERAFGPNAAIDYDGLILGFMDRHLRGAGAGAAPPGSGEDAAAAPDAPLKPVRLFVMGENAWRQEDTWPPAGSRPVILHLRGAAGPAKARLASEAPAEEASSSAFLADPLDPVSDPFATESGAHDYRSLVDRKDVLVFETEPFAEPLRALGPITARIHLSTDGRDADLWLKLFDVAPDGTAWNLMSPGLDVLRASYRDGGPERKLLEPGRVYELHFRNLMTGNRFAAGHRLRLVVASAFFPHFSRNLHTGELETESKAARKAEIRVHHDRARPSSMTLTVVP
jgi:putative CocE/NonD family hydrolase